MHIRQPMFTGAQTYRLVFIDWVLDAACVLGHPGGVEYGDTGHAQYRRRQSEVDAGWRDLKQKTNIEQNGSRQPSFVRRCVLTELTQSQLLTFLDNLLEGQRSAMNIKNATVLVLYLKDLLGSLLHARPHLVAETPQRVKLQDGVDALAGLLVMELRHHHFGHRVGDLYRAQEEHGSWRGCREGGCR